MTRRMRSCLSVSGVGQQRGSLVQSVHLSFRLCPSSLAFVSCASGLVLNPDPESDSEDSEPDDDDDPVIPSPEMDDVKGESCSF